MAYLLSESLLRQIQDMLGQRNLSPTLIGGPALHLRAGQDYLPFDLFYVKASDKLRIYLPASCLIFNGEALEVDDTDLTAVIGRPGWYDFDPPTLVDPVVSARIYAVAYPVSEHAPRKIRIMADDANMIGRVLSVTARAIADVTTLGAYRWRIDTLWHGILVLDQPFPFGSRRWPWGVDIEGAALTVGIGYGRRGSASFVTPAAVAVTIAHDGYYIGWEYNPDPSVNSLSVMTAEQANLPVDADGFVRGPLYRVSFADDVVTGVYAVHTSIVPIPLFGR